MYAVIQIGSFQYKVSEGDTIETQLLDSKEGDKITLEQVLLVVDDLKVEIGQPFLKSAKITAQVVRHLKGPKAISFKYRRRKDSKWKKGHRQNLTALSITKISA